MPEVGAAGSLPPVWEARYERLIRQTLQGTCLLVSSARKRNQKAKAAEKKKRKAENGKLWARHTDLFANRPRRSVLDFSMSWYGDGSTILGIAID